MTSTTSDFARFAPTDEQVAFAVQYAKDNGHDSVFVAVSFPGKKPGLWITDQERNAVMDGDQPVIWDDRTTALMALDLGGHGNALFRVYKDGYVHLVSEAMQD